MAPIGALHPESGKIRQATREVNAVDFQSWRVSRIRKTVARSRMGQFVHLGSSASTRGERPISEFIWLDSEIPRVAYRKRQGEILRFQESDGLHRSPAFGPLPQGGIGMTVKG